MLQFTIAPDYLPSHFGTWYLLGDFVRREMNCTIHLNMPGNSDELTDTLAGQQDGMAYVNPFSASKLIREQGWIPLLKPACGSDEMVAVCRSHSPYKSLRDIKSGCKISFSDKDMYLIGMRLMEGFDLSEHNTLTFAENSEEAVLSAVFHKRAEIGFLMAETYDNLSDFGKRLFRPIIRSQIDDMHHVMLLHPNSAARAEEVKAAFINLNLSSEGRSILEEFRHSEGFAATEAEEVENMLDLLQTLED